MTNSKSIAKFLTLTIGNELYFLPHRDSMGNGKDVLREKSFRFALRIVRLNQFLVQETREYVISKQVLKSGTSIGANIVEGGKAESKADFIHKLAIARKEAFETEYWLELLRDSRMITVKQAESLLIDCRELQMILTASIKTAKKI